MKQMEVIGLIKDTTLIFYLNSGKTQFFINVKLDIIS